MENKIHQDSLSDELVILMVDDQAIFGEVLRRMVSVEDSWKFHFCKNPLEALDVAREIKPTVILQDLVMPEMDGLELVKKFREEPITKDVPMIVLSSTEDSAVKYKAFENGANDYMVKLPDALEVLARIRYHSKAYMNFRELNKAMKLLNESQNALRKELNEAEIYVSSLFPQKIDDKNFRTDWIFKSSTSLGGDCFGYHYLDEDNFAMYLLDVCGHGVGAALLSVSAMNVLRSQSLPDTDFKNPSQVLSRLSVAFDMDKQNGMFFTIWYGVYNIKNRELTYASGGHPPAVLLSENQKDFLSTKGLVIGAMPDCQYKSASVKVAENSRLYVFSDGVYEVVKASDKEMMTLENFADELEKAPQAKSKILDMLAFTQEVQGCESFEDDFTLCEIILK